MTVQEADLRLFYIRGEGRIEAAYGRDSTIKVDKGRCLYLVRLELEPVGGLELNDDKFDLMVRTTQDGITFQRGRGGGHRGWVGEEIPFEQLVKDAVFPRIRAKGTPDTVVTDALNNLLQGFHYNCYAIICSEFEGYRDGLGRDFSRIRTYLPVITQAVSEVQPLLS
ncbi:hypothetical protein HYX12_04195 [Candidatus Woesearchaeota archaeon]|nr:hypothetical protein [Candidatus Woesearchaeota archaeon]